ncbi:MAG: acyl-CoA dehydrogenase [Gammaproteobacteria bacterium]|nr:MAG: acyl-CoA dehydrogenase [Gammaproteobacteria bacterium]
MIIPGDLQDLRDLTRRFVQRELLPLEQQLLDEDDLPETVWRGLTEKSVGLGLYALGVPEEFGGAGIGILGQTLVAEEMGQVAVGFRHLAGAPVGANSIIRFGTQWQRETYARPLTNGAQRCGWGATEPGAGSDLGGIRTTARREGDCWVIDGAKHYMTGADHYDFMICFALTDAARGLHGGLTAFILEKTLPGFQIGRRMRMMGREGLHSYEIFFDELRVPDANRLGDVGAAYPILMDQVHEMRLLMGGTCVGTAERLLRLAADHARHRVQFGRPIGRFQAIQWMLADSAIEIEAARALTLEAAAKLDAGQDAAVETAMVKAFASEMVGRVADRSLQIHGGAGYCKDLPIESIYRSVRLFRVAEGTTEIQRTIIARSLLKHGPPVLF